VTHLTSLLGILKEDSEDVCLPVCGPEQYTVFARMMIQ
jgi:hypothetical protein